MPFYEYQCSHCDHFFEALQKISEAPLKKCPSCGKSTLKKLVSAPVFRLKGSGWYETDFKSDQEQKRNLAGAEKDASDSGAGEATNKGKAETDSAGKTDAKPQAQGSPEGAPAKPAAASGGSGTRPASKAAPTARAGSGARPAAGAGTARTARASARSGAARPSKRAPPSGRSRVSSSRTRPKRGRR